MAARLEGGILGEEALDELEFFLLFPQEHVDQELLLPFELLHNGFGNVGDHPGNNEAEEHHKILEYGEKSRRVTKAEMDQRQMKRVKQFLTGKIHRNDSRDTF